MRVTNLIANAHPNANVSWARESGVWNAGAEEVLTYLIDLIAVRCLEGDIDA
jgi:hypothetical protein